MARRSTEGSSTPKVRGRKVAKAKRKISTRTQRRKRPSVTDLREQLRRRIDELTEAREQQAATAEVLQVISSSRGELKPVFESMLANAMRLCGAQCGFIYQVEAGAMRAMAEIGVPAALAEYRRQHPHTGGATTPVDLMRATKKPAHVHDARESEAYRMGNPNAVAGVELGGARTVLYIPMINGDDIVGVINLYRQELRPFTDEQIALLESFASQAVIAIENARLFEQTKEALRKLEVRSSELAESLQHQTATSQILSVISGSKADIQPAFDSIVDSAARLFEPCGATITTLKDGQLHWNATAATLPDFDIERAKAIYPIPFDPERAPSARALLERRIIEIPDIAAPDSPEFTRKAAAAGGFQSATFVPLIKQDKGIGTIILTHLRAGFRLSEKQLALVRTFADQAVIAIENVRLFDEVQAKTNDLEESLQQQTATADVLKVISRSAFDLQAVLDTLIKSAAQLCDANAGHIYLREAEAYRLAACSGFSHEYEEFLKRRAILPGRDTLVGRTAEECKIVSIPDILLDTDYRYHDAQRLGGFRTMLGIPMLVDGAPIGVFGMTRSDVRPFNDNQINLLTTFADQAVIAIENVRLLEEVQARTRDLSESLEQQTATSEVLSVISSSAGDLVPVFDAMLDKAMNLCRADFGVLNTFDGEFFHTAATRGIPPAYDKYRRSQPLEYGPGTAPARLLQGESIVEIYDLHESDAYREGELNRRALVDLGGARSLLAVPLLRDERVVGNVMIFRQDTRRFSEKQITLLKQFAAQAVIAIENTRLLRELRASTEELRESLQQQTATSEVLETISSATGELGQVFQKMLENATRICGAKFGTMTLYEEGGFRTAALYNAPQAYVDTQFYKLIRPHPESGLGTVERTHQTVHIDDIRTQPPYVEGNPNVRALADLAGARTLVIVPMLKENELIGSITIFRQEVRPFTDKQTELVTNFANQAVIAIENARLLNELRERTTALTQSLEELRTAQDRLVQTEKLASLGQLTAGIAHEIKNPLNFVNNFSALSAELIDEMKDVLSGMSLDSDKREELDEIMQMLKTNLEKVVQHGKRADSIVKNMLLHSRQGSGEHRLVDINTIVDESLNLAYHGARAEKTGFNITMQRNFDPEVGMADVYPQEITRVLLNLISNGFYATTKRKTEAGDGFEPTLTATTKNLGDKIEIRIRDNGTGIPDEIKEKIFNPFFTTKPAGEGTGLGLSMSHDIIVKQHSGIIDVDTASGAFTEFRIVLPRAAASVVKSGEHQ